ncbi:MAG: DUF1385 domain-containing protein [Oscillospiraceae bacterium]|nr:DUF1385 domain-containing protein [Oscillospiraceae bacterium]
MAKHKSKIGGQALLEGIMMRGVRKSAMACRLPDGSIDTEVWNENPLKIHRKIPFVRGVFNFVSSLVTGYKCLMKSAEKQALEEEKIKGQTDNKAGNEKSEKVVFGLLMGAAMVIGIAIAVGLFIFAPMQIVKFTEGFITNSIVKTVLEGIVKILLFALYLWATSLMKDLRRTYEYHGAEHKTIACFESGEELTVENIKKHSRFHPRCGTSFLFLVMFVSIFAHSFLKWDNIFIRMGISIAMLPFIVGITYELIRIAGSFDNIFTRILSAPGMALQRLTTKEPDDLQIEIAVAAITPCLPENLEEDQW